MFLEDFNKVSLAETDCALCRFAESLTTNQTQHYEQQVNELKKMGFTDRAILDATLVVAYFNFVNRIVLGLGVELEKDGAEGYKFD